jgi:hypothetical protein
MTEEQEQDRKQKIFAIAAHFGQVDLYELQNNPNLTLDSSWPKDLEKYVTPRLLDLFNSEWFCKFGYCYFCNFFDGYNKLHYKYFFAKNSKNKLIPFSGKCRHVFNREQNSLFTNTKYQYVDPKFSCHLWQPMNLYFQIIQIQIANKLSEDMSVYDIEDYAFDLHNINIWNYFFNKYNRNELF